MSRRHELSESQWESIRELLPGKTGDPGRTAADNRLFVNAVMYVLKTGIPWEDLPARFGKWNSVWRRFDRWCENGIWETLARTLGAPDVAEIHLDSSSVKAHPAASTGRRAASEKKRKPMRGVVSDAAVAG